MQWFSTCVTLGFGWVGFVLVLYAVPIVLAYSYDSDYFGNVRPWRHHLSLGRSRFSIFSNTIGIFILFTWPVCLVCPFSAHSFKYWGYNLGGGDGVRTFSEQHPKQVHSDGPIVSHGQLEVYSNEPNSSDSVCGLSSAMAHHVLYRLKKNHLNASTSICDYTSCIEWSPLHGNV